MIPLFQSPEVLMSEPKADPAEFTEAIRDMTARARAVGIHLPPIHESDQIPADEVSLPTPGARCCCELLEITTPVQFARGEVEYVRGLHNGCPIHETAAERKLRTARELTAATMERRRAEAERKARMR
jgi:hypothetical protein